LAHAASEALAVSRQTASSRLSHWPLANEKAAKHMLIASVKRARTLIKTAAAHGTFDKPISKTSLDILALPFPLYTKSQATHYSKKYENSDTRI